jgi:hypothetical protein
MSGNSIEDVIQQVSKIYQTYLNLFALKHRVNTTKSEVNSEKIADIINSILSPKNWFFEVSAWSILANVY